MAFIGLAGVAVAQSGAQTVPLPESGSSASVSAKTPEQCWSYCGSFCTIAYFFTGGRDPNCLLTQHSRPMMGMQGGPYVTWSNLRQSALSDDDVADHFPESVLENRDRFTPEQIARAEARVQTLQPDADADFTETGVAQCQAGQLRSGTQWVFNLGGGMLSSVYYQHGAVVCSPNSDRFYVIGGSAMQLYRCWPHFVDCRRRADGDVPLGSPLGPASGGITERWPMLDPQGNETGNILARL